MLSTDTHYILAGPLDGLATLPMGPTDGIDRYSPALWRAYSMISAQAQPKASTDTPHLILAGPLNSLGTDTMGPPEGLTSTFTHTVVGPLNVIGHRATGPTDGIDPHSSHSGRPT